MLLCRKLLLNILKQDRWRGITAKRQEISWNTISDLRCEIFKCQQPADFGTFSDRVGSIRYTPEFSWSLLHSVTKTVIALIPEPGLKNPRWWCLVAATSCVLLPDSRGQACKNKRLGRSEEKSSHEFHVEAAFDHLEGVRSYEPCDAADLIWILLSTFPNLPPSFSNRNPFTILATTPTFLHLTSSPGVSWG